MASFGIYVKVLGGTHFRSKTLLWANRDIRGQVLLNKLSRVTQQLNTLRSIWDGQRPAFTEKEAWEHYTRNSNKHSCALLIRLLL